MNVGLPGTGIGGLFYLLLIFLMPLFELPRLLRGERSRERWALILRQWIFALGILVVTWGWAIALGAMVARVHSWLSPSGQPLKNVQVIAVSTGLIALSTLAGVLLLVHGLRLLRRAMGLRSQVVRQ
jgi:hypothetical protein